jgi:hypothetical protein
MRNKAFMTVLLGTGLWLACVGPGEAFYWKRHKAACAATVWNEAEAYPTHVLGGPVPEYGKDANIVPNPYPWHYPAMFSGFRHYHVVPLIVPDSTEVAPGPFDKKAEQAPVPRKKL